MKKKYILDIDVFSYLVKFVSLKHIHEYLIEWCHDLLCYPVKAFLLEWSLNVGTQDLF